MAREKTLFDTVERAVISETSQIDRLIVDRCTEAYDELIAENPEGYKQKMADAWAQMGFDSEHPIKDEDRPTALDRMKTMCIAAYARRHRLTLVQSVNQLKRLRDGT